MKFRYFNSLFLIIVYFICWFYTTISFVVNFRWQPWSLSDWWNWVLLVNFTNFWHFINILPRIRSRLSLLLFLWISFVFSNIILIGDIWLTCWHHHHCLWLIRLSSSLYQVLLELTINIHCLHQEFICGYKDC